MLFGLCRQLGMAPIPAAATALAFAWCTSVWVYARYPYSETLQLVCFTGFFAKLLDCRQRPTWRQATLLGLWAGLLVNAKPVFLLSGLGGGLFLAWELRRNRRALALIAAASLATSAPLGAIYLYYNYLRWNGIFATGYGIAFAGTGMSTPVGILHESPLVGLYGMFMSPGKSIFLYSPPLLLTLYALPRFIRRLRHVALAMLLTVLPGLYVHAQMISWAGDFAWGPRYLTFALGVLLLPAGFLLEDWLRIGPRLHRGVALAACTLVCAAGAGVTYLGNAIYWDHYIRIEEEAAQFWLGTPNNRGDGISTPNMPCPVCFETIYSLQWLPPFQHIVGNYWLLPHLTNNDNWMVAERDAPWRRYTNLQIDIHKSYARARVDWWFVEYRHTFPRLAWTLVIGLPTLSLLMLILFLVRSRARVTRATSRARSDPASRGGGLHGLDVAQAQIEEQALEHLGLLRAEIAFGLFLQDGEQVDGVLGHGEIAGGLLLAGPGLSAQVRDGGAAEREHQSGEVCGRERRRHFWLGAQIAVGLGSSRRRRLACLRSARGRRRGVLVLTARDEGATISYREARRFFNRISHDGASVRRPGPGFNSLARRRGCELGVGRLGLGAHHPLAGVRERLEEALVLLAGDEATFDVALHGTGVEQASVFAFFVATHGVKTVSQDRAASQWLHEP